MSGESPAFIAPSVFLVSAMCVLATPFSLSLSLGLGRRPEPIRHPAVAEVLRSNEALAEAAKAVRVAEMDLTQIECIVRDDNANWIERLRVTPEIASRDLLDTLGNEPYWAIYFFYTRDPGLNIKDGPEGAWVFVRRSDLKILGLVRG